MSKESFKLFAQSHPELVKHVSTGAMSWQKFYEIYDLYGENSNAWAPYLETTVVAESTSSLLGDTSLKEIFNTIKKVDLDTVKRGVDGLQKAVNLLQDLTGKSSSNNTPYKKRPMYQYFED